MKIRVNRNIPAEMVEQTGMTLWQFILCYLYFFSLLNNLGLCACHSSMFINSMKAQEMIAGISSLSSLPFCALPEMGTLRVLVVCQNPNYVESSNCIWGWFFFLLLHTQGHRLSLSVTDRLSRQQCSTEQGEHWKLTVRQYSKRYYYSFSHSHGGSASCDWIRCSVSKVN